MKILFLISNLGIGGAEKQLVAWAGLLQKNLTADVSIASFSTPQTNRLGQLEELGIPTIVVGGEQGTFQRINRVIAFGRANKADVVHAFSCYLSPLALVVSKALGAQAASSFRGDGLADIQGISRVLRYPTLHAIKYYTSNSREALSRVAPHVAKNALLEYVPNLVESFSSGMSDHCYSRESRSLRVLAVGRLDENKRMDIFLRALAISREKIPELTGVIVGDGPCRGDLAAQAESLGLGPDAVKFTGSLADPHESYANADLFLHLARSEGAPNVVLEAMAMGLPVIATPAGELPRIIQHSVNGVIVPFDDAESVAARLTNLARSPEERARLGSQARLDIINSFSESRVAEALARFYSAIPISRH